MNEITLWDIIERYYEKSRYEGDDRISQKSVRRAEVNWIRLSEDKSNGICA